MLDTDYENYILLYSCQENAEFRDKDEGHELSPEDVWTLSEKELDENGEIVYQFAEEVIEDPVHKEKVQILWRAPKMDIQAQLIKKDAKN